MRFENLIKSTPSLSTEDLKLEGLKKFQEAEIKKTSYDHAKQNGKLWTQEQKDASKLAKKAARREKRLAKKAVK